MISAPSGNSRVIRLTAVWIIRREFVIGMCEWISRMREFFRKIIGWWILGGSLLR